MFQNIQPVTITPRALVEIKKTIKAQNLADEYRLRIGIQGGGCSGSELILGFDKEKEGDMAFDLEGIRVVLNKKHALFVIGKELDYVDNGEVNGFVFFDALKKENKVSPDNPPLSGQ